MASPSDKGPPPELDPVEASRMTFGEHLDELRVRVLRALWGFLLAFIICFVYGEALLRLVCEPLYWVLRENGYPPSLFPRRVTEVFFTTIKVSAIAGLVLSSPWLSLQIWSFIAAGLYQHERRMVHTYVPLSVICFVSGTVFFYLLVLPAALNYFVAFGRNVDITPKGGKPFNIAWFYPDPDKAAPRPALARELPVTFPDGREVKLSVPADALPPVVPTLEKPPPDDQLRPGMIWIDAATQDIRIAVREFTLDDNTMIDRAMAGMGAKDLKPVRTKWDIRQVSFQPESFLAHAFTMDDYVSFVCVMTLMFGLGFQVPLVVIFAVKLGMTDRPGLKAARKYVAFAVVVLAAIMTPTPDPFTQFLLAGPMYGLYEFGIFLARFTSPLAAPEEETAPAVAGAGGRPPGGGSSSPVGSRAVDPVVTTTDAPAGATGAGAEAGMTPASSGAADAGGASSPTAATDAPAETSPADATAAGEGSTPVATAGGNGAAKSDAPGKDLPKREVDRSLDDD